MHLDYVKSPMNFHQKILFCIEINRSYAVKAYRGFTPVNLYDILLHSFQHKITTFSQISQILEKVENSSADIHSELKAAGKNLLSLLLILCMDNIKANNTFLLSEAANLYLRSRNAYRALRLILILSHEKTFRTFF